MGNEYSESTLVMHALLKTNQLSRQYGDQIAVDSLNFEINKGEVLGFLGPNGAGKSTTMNMLSGNLAPSHGEIMICGYDLLTHPKQAKKHLGYLPEQPPLYKDLSVIEFLSFCSKLHLIPASKQQKSVKSVIERCGLGQVKNKLITNLSKGYQQRVGIAQAIIHGPDVVILDEPTSGLDPIQIKEIRLLIREVANEHSVILSTHILPEVEMLCDRVQIINKGKLIFDDEISTLTELMHVSNILVRFNQPPMLSELTRLEGVISVDHLSTNHYRINYLPENNPTQSILTHAVANNWQLTELMPEQHSLEDVFVNIIQQEQSSKPEAA